MAESQGLGSIDSRRILAATRSRGLTLVEVAELIGAPTAEVTSAIRALFSQGLLLKECVEDDTTPVYRAR